METILSLPQAPPANPKSLAGRKGLRRNLNMLNWLKEKLKKKYRDHRCLYCKTLLMRHWTELSIKTKVKGEKGVKHIIS